jgi:glyoxalase/bleomycin resistance protein/dioxygenase superfamily protein
MKPAESRATQAAFLYVYVDDADAIHRRAVEAGARSLEEPMDMPYGDRRGMVENRWATSGRSPPSAPRARGDDRLDHGATRSTQTGK